MLGFNLSPVLMLCLFDGSSEGIVVFLISVLLLESALGLGSGITLIILANIKRFNTSLIKKL